MHCDPSAWEGSAHSPWRPVAGAAISAARCVIAASATSRGSPPEPVPRPYVRLPIPDSRPSATR
jgi:hypothetical protein